jgi:hypothetical protein
MMNASLIFLYKWEVSVFATIQSREISALYCRVKQIPIVEGVHFKVYELVDSEVSSGIISRINGEVRGVYKHIALHNDGRGFIFDIENNKLFGPLGLCDLIIAAE